MVGTVRFLHRRHILYRDLKSENMGFDCNGTPKLFGFGLTKRLLEGDRAPPDPEGWTTREVDTRTLEFRKLKHITPFAGAIENCGKLQLLLTII